MIKYLITLLILLTSCSPLEQNNNIQISNSSLNSTSSSIQIKKTYTVFLDTDGGNSLQSIILNEGQNINLPTPIKSGYEFLGWMYKSSNNDFNLTQMPGNDIYLKASWQQNIESIKQDLFKISQTYYQNSIQTPLKVAKIGNSTFESTFMYFPISDEIVLTFRQTYQNLNTVIQTNIDMRFKFGKLQESDKIKFDSSMLVNNRLVSLATVNVFNLDYESYDDITFNYKINYNDHYDTYKELEDTIKDFVRYAYGDLASELIIKHKFLYPNKIIKG
jgi:uncharacterized repeat protein (TIGR02543 family)